MPHMAHPDLGQMHVVTQEHMAHAGESEMVAIIHSPGQPETYVVALQEHHHGAASSREAVP